jgi:hypothetical protein
MRKLRISIAWVMGFILLVALAMAALRSHSEIWAGVLGLATGAVLCLALVGAVCCTGSERVWWLGFAAFGWLFLLPFPLGIYFSVHVPSEALLKVLAPLFGVQIGQPYPRDVAEQSYLLIGNYLWALVSAVLGGLLVSALFGSVTRRPDVAAAGSRTIGPESPWSWVLPPVVVSSGLVLIISIAVAGAQLDPGVWAGLTYLMTWWLFALTALGAVFASGRRREFWLGATFFGMGFMIVVFRSSYYYPEGARPFLPTMTVLEGIRPLFETVAGGLSANPHNIASANARVQKALDLRVPMQFPDETTLEDLLKYIRDATRGPGGRVIPIYVDPIGLQEAEQSMTSTVRGIDLEGVKLRTSLRLCLKQIQPAYVVRDGLLLITSQEDLDSLFRSPRDDAFQLAGHCVLAVIAAGLGGAAAPLVCDLARTNRGHAAVE